MPKSTRRSTPSCSGRPSRSCTWWQHLPKCPKVVRRKAREEYQSCKQGAFESLFDFKARFDSRYDAYKDQGNVELTEEDVAMDFLESLDRARYSKFIVETINDIAKGVMDPPKDVNQVYVLANTRLVVKESSGNLNVGASYVTVEATRPMRGRRNKSGTGKKGGKDNNGGGKLLSANEDDKDESSANKNKNKEEKQKKSLRTLNAVIAGEKDISQGIGWTMRTTCPMEKIWWA
jgi:hypothetical protein